VPDVSAIEIEVACALPEKQIVRSLRIHVGTTARQALRQSGLAKEFSSIDFESAPIGMFGEVVPDTYLPRANDRLEVYRPLRRDPREARLRRVEELGSNRSFGRPTKAKSNI